MQFEFFSQVGSIQALYTSSVVKVTYAEFQLQKSASADKCQASNFGRTEPSCRRAVVAGGRSSASNLQVPGILRLLPDTGLKTYEVTVL